MTSTPSPSFLRQPASYIAAVVLVVFYAASLQYGYLWDDYFELDRSLSETLAQIGHHFRPMVYFSFYLTPDFLHHPAGQRAINHAMIAIIALTLTAILRKGGIRLPWLFALVVLFQPTFVYAATWITMRVDCFVILFLLLTFLHMHGRWGLAFLLISDFSKAPFLLQNLWYAFVQWRAGHRLRALIAVLVMAGILVSIVGFWLHTSSTATSPTTKLDVPPLQHLVVIAAIRLAKLLEGIVLIHAPLFAFYMRDALFVLPLALAAMAVCWLAILVEIVRRRPKVPALAWHALALAVLSSAPFAINTDPRVLGPAIPFWFLFWILLAGDNRRMRMALVGLGLIGMLGSVLNYKLSDTGVYVTGDTSIDYTLCGAHELRIPAEQWRCDRSKIAGRIVETINAFGR